MGRDKGNGPKHTIFIRFDPENHQAACFSFRTEGSSWPLVGRGDLQSTREMRTRYHSRVALLCYCMLHVMRNPRVVVVVDSHIQRVVLASEETTVTQQVSHRPIKCQSRLWSQRGTRVNGSHHGDNPLLRPTGIQIATKSYAALQAMAPTNIKTVHQTSILHIESNLDRLGMLSPTHDQRSQQKKTERLRKNYAPTSFDQQVQDSQGHTLYRNKNK